MKRATLRNPVHLPPALGTLSRRSLNVALMPAEMGRGIWVRRADLDVEWPVSLEHLVPAVHCTAIGSADTSVSYVEHALAALCAARISDALIVTDGPELPLFDGSALTWWEVLKTAGRAQSQEVWEPLVLPNAVYVVSGSGAIVGLPAETPSVAYVLDYQEPLIGRQWARFTPDADFGDELAPARTFATADQVREMLGQEEIPSEVEALSVVIYDDHVSAAQPLPHAFARHKLVDLIGDLFLCGRPIIGQIVALRTGHGDNHAFLGEVLRAASQSTRADR
ncbi:MAG: hypothetical protein HPY69_12170 [Armatimonadetes bacterium]|nr:hypothetical protein [Armatimonadota bacterium]